MNEKPLLRVENLGVNFYTRHGVVNAVTDTNFEIQKNEILGLVGESGCGKSVTALSILRLLLEPPAKIMGGRILYKGEDLLKKAEKEIREIRGKEISMIFQNPMSSLNPVLTIGFQVSEPIILHQDLKDDKEVKRRTVEILRQMGIPEAEKRLKDYPHAFSGGMRQRTMIAMALSCSPSLLIADEPTTSLDVTIQVQILKLMRNLRKEFGSSILLITHDFGVAAQLCDTIAVMYAGETIEYGSAVDVLKDPKHPYTKCLLSSIPRIDIEIERLEPIKGSVPNAMNYPAGCRFHPRCPYLIEDKCPEEEPKVTKLAERRMVKCHLYRR
ncbi:MAG: ABC transporter ATP-binding protein [Theionarchaea archaeon]|nr:MAG: peptide ABC transporter ATP-binding protein [Theionarchaea archaeon DG-70]MBU7010286.1 ABC transporter ATP-binding protein [Theionarchaea archaeon]